MSIDADPLALIATFIAASLLLGRDAMSSRRTIWRHVRRARRTGV